MAFTRPNFWVWDFWLADDGNQFHMFYLHAPTSLGDPDLRHRNARIGHATSTDLIEWVDLGVVLGPGSSGDFDETATWTGSVLQGPDGIWRMFYTGSVFPDAHSEENIETVGVATSTDLHTWTKQPGPLTVADPRWYETLGASNWPEEAWRDPWVHPDPSGTGWRMLVTARSIEGDSDNRGVIGQAYSPDLQRWEVRAPLSAPGSGFAHLEVPQLVEVDGHNLLLFSCDTAKLAASRPMASERGGIWVVNVPDPLGPFDIAAATLLSNERRYSGRLIRDRTSRWVMLAFDAADADGDFVGSISDPVSLHWDHEAGNLQVESASEND